MPSPQRRLRPPSVAGSIEGGAKKAGFDTTAERPVQRPQAGSERKPLLAGHHRRGLA